MWECQVSESSKSSPKKLVLQVVLMWWWSRLILFITLWEGLVTNCTNLVFSRLSVSRFALNHLVNPLIEFSTHSLNKSGSRCVQIIVVSSAKSVGREFSPIEPGKSLIYIRKSTAVFMTPVSILDLKLTQGCPELKLLWSNERNKLCQTELMYIIYSLLCNTFKTNLVIFRPVTKN